MRALAPLLLAVVVAPAASWVSAPLARSRNNAISAKKKGGGGKKKGGVPKHKQQSSFEKAANFELKPYESNAGRQLAELVVAGANSNSTIEQAKALPEDDPLQRQPDISLAKAELNWEPSIELAKGLEKTIQYFDSIDLSHFRAPTPNY